MTEEDIRRLVATMKDLTPEEELAWMEKLRGAAAQLPTVRIETMKAGIPDSNTDYSSAF